MGEDFFLPMYFNGLYSKEEQNKIDLFSREFYLDALEFYSKKTSKKGRHEIIQGFRYLAAKIKNVDDSHEILSIWSNTSPSMLLREAFFRSQPNLVTEFKIHVTSILNARNEYLTNRRDKELRRLKEKAARSEIIIDSLLKEREKSKNADAPASIKIEELLVQFNFKHRESFKLFFEDLTNSSINPTIINDKEFSAIALMLHNTGWVNKDTKFSTWLRLFSEACHRTKTPTYKPSQVKDTVENLKNRYLFLDKLP